MKGRYPAHEITVFERNPPGVTYGWGVVFWDDLLEQLLGNDSTTAREIGASSFRLERPAQYKPSHFIENDRRSAREVRLAAW